MGSHSFYTVLYFSYLICTLFVKTLLAVFPLNPTVFHFSTNFFLHHAKTNLGSRLGRRHPRPNNTTNLPMESKLPNDHLTRRSTRPRFYRPPATIRRRIQRHLVKFR